MFPRGIQHVRKLVFSKSNNNKNYRTQCALILSVKVTCDMSDIQYDP